MHLFLIICLLVVALLLIGIILIQQGKGAEMGASFGGGGSNTLFGAPGAGNFLTKSTTILAIVFFGLAIAIGIVGNKETNDINDLIAEEQTELSVQGEEIPTETPEVISTEIPTQAVETISTAIPTEQEATDAIEAAKTELSEKADEVKADATEALDNAKVDAEQALESAEEDAKEKAKEKAAELLKKDGDQ